MSASQTMTKIFLIRKRNDRMLDLWTPVASAVVEPVVRSRVFNRYRKVGLNALSGLDEMITRDFRWNHHLLDPTYDKR